MRTTVLMALHPWNPIDIRSDYSDISDNQDFDVIPNLTFSESRSLPLSMLMSDPPVTEAWIYTHHSVVEKTSRIVYEEPMSRRYKDSVSYEESASEGRKASEREHIPSRRYLHLPLVTESAASFRDLRCVCGQPDQRRCGSHDEDG